jgi:membrane protein required for colicin V production
MMSTFNAFDWLLLGLLAWSTFAALRRGLVRTLFSLGGWTVGPLLASWYSAELATRLLRWFKPMATAQLVAFLLILVATVMVASLLGSVLHRTVRAVGLGTMDRLGGGLFGIARGCLIGVSALMAIAAFSPRSETISQSRLTPYFLAGAHAVCFLVPTDFRLLVAHGATRLRHNSSDWSRSIESTARAHGR